MLLDNKIHRDDLNKENLWLEEQDKEINHLVLINGVHNKQMVKDLIVDLDLVQLDKEEDLQEEEQDRCLQDLKTKCIKEQ